MERIIPMNLEYVVELCIYIQHKGRIRSVLATPSFVFLCSSNNPFFMVIARMVEREIERANKRAAEILSILVEM